MKVLNAIQYFFIVVLTIISGTLIILTFYLPKNGLYGFVSKKFWSPGLLLIAGAKLRVIGKENVDVTENYIYISNHESDFDIPAIYSAIPVNLYFIAKKELQKVPFLGWAMQSVGMIFIDRTNREKAVSSLAAAGKIIKKGKSVISFPEGTRSVSGKLAKFKKGSFMLAVENNIGVVPVAVDGTFEVFPPKQYKLYPGDVTVIIGKPIKPEDYKGLSPEQFAGEVQKKVMQMLETKKPV